METLYSLDGTGEIGTDELSIETSTGEIGISEIGEPMVATTTIPYQTTERCYTYDAENRLRINNGKLVDKNPG